MKMVSKLALGAALALASTVAIGPAHAQEEEAPPATGPGGEVATEYDPGNLSDPVRVPIAAAQEARTAGDTATALTQIQTAIPLIQNDDDRYLVGSELLQVAVAMQTAGAPVEQTTPLLVQGAQLSLDSGRTAIARRPTLYNVVGNAAVAAENYPAAVTAYENAARYLPNDASVAISLADAYLRSGNTAAGLQAADRAIQLQTDSGQPIDATWISVPLIAAYEGNNAEATARYGAMMVRHFGDDPERVNQALSAFNAVSTFDEQGEFDLFRLMRATDSLTPSVATRYIGLAAIRGLPGEAQAAATASGQTPPADLAARITEDRASLPGSESSARSAADGQIALNTADAYAGYGDHAKAIELYDLALQKGGVDADTVNLRRGVALAAAGRTDEARAAFQAVGGPPRAGLAAFWLAWLDHQAGGAAPAATTPAPAPAPTPAETPAEQPSGG